MAVVILAESEGRVAVTVASSGTIVVVYELAFVALVVVVVVVVVDLTRVSHGFQDFGRLRLSMSWPSTSWPRAGCPRAARLVVHELAVHELVVHKLVVHELLNLVFSLIAVVISTTCSEILKSTWKPCEIRTLSLGKS